jgi:site-specific DNA-methyltransferase (adenine-specific)
MIDLRNGDCIEQMRQLPPNSVDSIVTDPPYELGFMGKSWDSTGIAYSVKMWDEALRVLKPGGHLLAFSGSRTYHRMAVAIEDAGFEIRDQIMWVYGSGFPKSMDVSKAIDKQAGVEREVVGKHPQPGSTKLRTAMGDNWQESPDITAPTTDKAKQWAGWGTALKPAHEPIVLARKPLIGTVATNVIIHGTGALNIDGTRVATYGEKIQPFGSPTNSSGGLLNGTNQVRNPETIANALEKVNVLGRWPANFIHDGSDEVVELFPDTKGKIGMTQGGSGSNIGAVGVKKSATSKISDGIPDSGSAARFFYCAKASKKDRNEGLDDFTGKEVGTKGNGLARTCASCGASTLQGCECPDRTYVNPTRANHHPTVKPTDLMRYLVRMITPANGVVLDPFMGSGSTGKAAVLERFSFIGIDQSADYLEIATARIKHAQEQIEGQLL